MTCGNLPTGGCDDEDLGHTGPCTWKSESPERREERAARNKVKKHRRKAKKAQNVAALTYAGSALRARDDDYLRGWSGLW